MLRESYKDSDEGVSRETTLHNALSDYRMVA